MKIITIISVFLFSSIALAEESSEKFIKQFSLCEEKMGLSQIEYCTNEVSSEVAVKMTELYKELHGFLREKYRAELEASQANWESYKRSDCEFYVGGKSGDRAAMSMSVCIYRKQITRLKELEHYNGVKEYNDSAW